MNFDRRYELVSVFLWLALAAKMNEKLGGKSSEWEENLRIARLIGFQECAPAALSIHYLCRCHFSYLDFPQISSLLFGFTPPWQSLAPCQSLTQTPFLDVDPYSSTHTIETTPQMEKKCSMNYRSVFAMRKWSENIIYLPREMGNKNASNWNEIKAEWHKIH